MSIISLTSLDWAKEERYAWAGHSFRVMAKAKNYDEMVVGMMHAFYAGSGYTRGLYNCDVEGDPEWETALDLFVPPLRIKRFRSWDEITDDYLLGLNLPRGLTESECQDWMLEQTLWSESYAGYIRKISKNRIARNVMIHKLEDMLDVLRNPGKYMEESGSQYYILPWKTHRGVDVRIGRNCLCQMRIPKADDTLLLRDPTDEERENLIGKYDRALTELTKKEAEFPVADIFSKKEHQENEARFHAWFISWMNHDKVMDKELEIEETADENEY